MISASLSPNTEANDVWLALRLLFSPWKWKRGNGIGKIESWFRTYGGTDCAVSFNSGRSALLGLCKAFGFLRGDEIIMQAFSCVAVANSVRWNGASAVFADIDDTYNIDPKDIAKKITSKTKAIIVQHTFGIPAQMDAILQIAKKHNLIVIEDCAHALGATYKGKKLGTLGDAAFFSFGRDKVISSVFGGVAIINSNLKTQSAKLIEYRKKLLFPSYGWIFQQLMHPISFACILPLYDLGIGKLLIIILQKLRVLSFPVYPEEKKGLQPKDFPTKYPNVLSQLALLQLKKLVRYNQNRKKIAEYYTDECKNLKEHITPISVDGSIYLRYPLLVDNPNLWHKKAKQHGILLGNWYHGVVDPIGTDLARIGYKRGSCPAAEEVAARIVNLPTRISANDAKQVMFALLKP